VAEAADVERAVSDAREWVRGLGPGWVARFDQMHCDVRRWAGQAGVDPRSQEFRAAWCVATTFLHRMASVIDGDDPQEADGLHRTADILAAVGLWGAVSGSGAAPGSPA
jgi:hypothetical protein